MYTGGANLYFTPGPIPRMIWMEMLHLYFILVETFLRKGSFALGDNDTNFSCRQLNFWNGLYDYQYYGIFYEKFMGFF